MDKLIYASATALAQAIRHKEVSSTEVVEAHLRRIEEVNPRLNAVVLLTGDRALAEAREADAALARGEVKGPLHGVPMTIKDALDTEGVISTGGTLGRAAFVPKEDATVVKRLRDAGGIMLGKTNLPELSLFWECDNLIHGRCNNPYDLTRGPGGSSGGEAAIIAAGGSPFGIGSDAGGSIRQPAHYCGIAGIKPTSGCVPRTGHFRPPGGIQDFRNQVGPLARFVEDLMLVLPIIAGPDSRDPAIVPGPLGDPQSVDLKGLRVSFHTDNGIASPTPETAEAVRRAVQCLADAGAQVEESLPADIGQVPEIYGRLRRLSGRSEIKQVLDAIGTREVHPFTRKWQESLADTSASAEEIFDCMAEWDAFRGSMLSYIQDYDVILSPVCAEPALPYGQTMDADKLPGFSYVTWYNLTGWPGVAVRGGTSPEGLPIDVQVGAGAWHDHVALAVARHIESALGGWQPPPL
ncbi:MAG: amidase [Chloroflexi bacterium]|nr:amidase [Chloroflexota bacterium]